MTPFRRREPRPWPEIMRRLRENVRLTPEEQRRLSLDMLNNVGPGEASNGLIYVPEQGRYFEANCYQSETDR